MILNDLVPEYIKNFEAYIPSKPDDVLKEIYGCDKLYRLNNNENPFGPPARSREILKNFNCSKVAIYPSGDAYHLRYKLSEKFGFHPDQFLVGNGANEVIAFVIKAFCEQGDNIITADKTFAVYEWVATFSGFNAKLIPLKNYTFDDVGMLNAIDERTKIIFICNPNNPTGTYWSKEKLKNFLDKVNEKQIVVIDEAYFEFVEKDNFPNGMDFINEYPNVVVFRTFSKMYGLAGLRIGYLVGSMEVVDIIRRTCVVYSVNKLAQVAAKAALDDEEHIIKTREHIRNEKSFLKRELERLKLTYIAEEGCYVMIKLPFSDTLAYRKLISKGIVIRSMTGFRYPNWIRVSIGSHEAMELFIENLEMIL
jgi:histidinol-phosphate aminotransferase